MSKSDLWDKASKMRLNPRLQLNQFSPLEEIRAEVEKEEAFLVASAPIRSAALEALATRPGYADMCAIMVEGNPVFDRALCKEPNEHERRVLQFADDCGMKSFRIIAWRLAHPSETIVETGIKLKVCRQDVYRAISAARAFGIQGVDKPRDLTGNLRDEHSQNFAKRVGRPPARGQKGPRK